jgi:hypothetical protein
MKKWTMVSMVIFIYCGLWAQDDPAIIKPYPLTIGVQKTTNIIFPLPIKQVERGNAFILSQQATANILQVKAARDSFPETNLSVVTSDGRLYSFLLHYGINPDTINLSFLRDSLSPQTVMEINSMKVLAEPSGGWRQFVMRDGVLLRLTGIYVQDDLMYYRFVISNESHIAYDMDRWRFFVKDRRQVKRTASQELEQPAVYEYGNLKRLGGQSKQTIVFVFPKFTIPANKRFHVQVMEKGGGRTLRLSVSNKAIAKASLIQ